MLDVTLLWVLYQLGHVSLPLLCQLHLGLSEPLPQVFISLARSEICLWALARACLLASSSSSISSILPWFFLMDFCTLPNSVCSSSSLETRPMIWASCLTMLETMEQMPNCNCLTFSLNQPQHWAESVIESPYQFGRLFVCAIGCFFFYIKLLVFGYKPSSVSQLFNLAL